MLCIEYPEYLAQGVQELQAWLEGPQEAGHRHEIHSVGKETCGDPLGFNQFGEAQGSSDSSDSVEQLPLNAQTALRSFPRF